MDHELGELRDAVADQAKHITEMAQTGMFASVHVQRMERNLQKMKSAIVALTPEPGEEPGPSTSVERDGNPLFEGETEGETEGEREQRGHNAEVEDDGASSTLVDVDPDGKLAKLVQLSLNGPLGATTVGNLVWDATFVLWGCCAANVTFYLIAGRNAQDPELLLPGLLMAGFFIVFVLSQTLVVRKLRKAVATRDGEQPGFLRQLLEGQASEQAVHDINKRMKEALSAAPMVSQVRSNQGSLKMRSLHATGRCHALCMEQDIIGGWAVFGACTYVLWDEVIANPSLAFAMAVAILLIPIFELIVAIGSMVSANVACTYVAHTARTMAEDLKKSSATTFDFDSLLKQLDKLNAQILEVEAMCNGVQLNLLANQLSAAIVMGAMALGPRPGDTEHWYNVYLAPPACLVAVLVLMLSGVVVALKEPAKVTYQCDAVKHELNRLRMTHDGKLSDDNTLARVEAVERFVVAVDLGYHIFGVRMSFDFMYVQRLVYSRVHVEPCTRVVACSYSCANTCGKECANNLFGYDYMY
jgi:hypothetical protein